MTQNEKYLWQCCQERTYNTQVIGPSGELINII